MARFRSVEVSVTGNTMRDSVNQATLSLTVPDSVNWEQVTVMAQKLVVALAGVWNEAIQDVHASARIVVETKEVERYGDILLSK